ncbi:MAG: Hsp20/alpha crystallin family protein [Gemmatimonadetes bacterium]|nr:Hsp20/alpha crystallin family protein [Gemmatimonadota bacterium]
MTYRSLISLPTLALRRDFDQIFDDVFAPQAIPAWSPSVDILETKDALVLEADLPGLSAKDLQVQADDRVLTISGTRTVAEGDTPEQRVRLRERVGGTFRRRFQLPKGVDASQIQATFTDGVLRVRIPKAAEAQPRTITVNTGAAIN